MKNNTIFLITLWLVLVILGNICAQIALFSQTLPFMENKSYFSKLLSNEFWASLQWAFALPSFRLGSKYFTVPQLFLAGYLIGFIIQLLSNAFWLKVKTPIDDYFTMVIMMLALYISKYSIFG
jgi:uncharacterized protein (DUF486 family)